MKTSRFLVVLISLLLISGIVTAQVMFPLKISDNKRYFVDQRDRPCLIHGDTPWSLMVGCSKEDVILYLNHRAKQGINTNHYMTTARTSDGATVIGYMPDRRSISVDMTRISGNKAVAWWYSPVDGNVAVIDTFATSGIQRFDPPAEAEWVIVIDDMSKNVPLSGKN